MGRISKTTCTMQCLVISSADEGAGATELFEWKPQDQSGLSVFLCRITGAKSLCFSSNIDLKKTRTPELVPEQAISLCATTLRSIHFRKCLPSLNEGLSCFSIARQLSCITISSCAVTELPHSLFDGLDNLRVLSITDSNLVTVPDSVATLPQLETLVLENNSLSSLPQHLGSTGVLRSINLQNNNLRAPALDFESMGELEELLLAWNPLEFLQPLSALVKLQTLSLFHLKVCANPIDDMNVDNLRNEFILEACNPFELHSDDPEVARSVPLRVSLLPVLRQGFFVSRVPPRTRGKYQNELIHCKHEDRLLHFRALIDLVGRSSSFHHYLIAMMFAFLTYNLRGQGHSSGLSAFMARPGVRSPVPDSEWKVGYGLTEPETDSTPAVDGLSAEASDSHAFIEAVKNQPGILKQLLSMMLSSECKTAFCSGVALSRALKYSDILAEEAVDGTALVEMNFGHGFVEGVVSMHVLSTILSHRLLVSKEAFRHIGKFLHLLRVPMTKVNDVECCLVRDTHVELLSHDECLNILRAEILNVVGNILYIPEHYDTLKKYPEITDLIKELNADKSLHVRIMARRCLILLGQHTDLCDAIRSTPRRAGVRILAVDGGGVRGRVPLRILEEIEKRTGRHIYELFDLIGGTSSGGFIAGSLGWKRWNLEKTRYCYAQLLRIAFINARSTLGTNDDNERGKIRNPKDFLKYLRRAGSQGLRVITTGAKYDAAPMEEFLKHFTGANARLLESLITTDYHVPRAFVTASAVHEFPGRVHVFRNYRVPENGVTRAEGDCDVAIWEALRSTSAAPTLYDEFTDTQGRRLQDGGIYVNNPAALAIAEARAIWPDRPIEAVVSLGTGAVIRKQREQNRSGALSLIDSAQVLVEAASSVERTDEYLRIVLPFLEKENGLKYFRICPDDERTNIEMDETDPRKLKRCDEGVDAYIMEHDYLFDEICELLLTDNDVEPMRKLSTRAAHQRCAILHGDKAHQGIVSAFSISAKTQDLVILPCWLSRGQLDLRHAIEGHLKSTNPTFVILLAQGVVEQSPGMPYIAFCDDNHFHVKHNRNDADDVIATIGIADSSDNIFISKSRSPSYLLPVSDVALISSLHDRHVAFITIHSCTVRQSSLVREAFARAGCASFIVLESKASSAVDTAARCLEDLKRRSTETTFQSTGVHGQ